LSGSITTSGAPALRASSTNGQSWIDVASTLAPHSTIRRASGMDSGGGPWFVP